MIYVAILLVSLAVGFLAGILFVYFVWINTGVYELCRTFDIRFQKWIENMKEEKKSLNGM